jgi:hypothetical protein
MIRITYFLNNEEIKAVTREYCPTGEYLNIKNIKYKVIKVTNLESRQLTKDKNQSIRMDVEYIGPPGSATKKKLVTSMLILSLCYGIACLLHLIQIAICPSVDLLW